MNDLISVVIPTHNSERTISSCLESIIQQSYRNLEIIIVDDGSTDNTVHLIKSFNDKRIKLFENGTNKGIPFTRQKGISQANGKYIAFIDSDDYNNTRRIETEYKYLEKYPDVSLVCSDYWIKKNRILVPKHVKLNDDELKYSMIFECIPQTSVTMVRKATIDNYDISFHQQYFVAQDYDFFFNVSKFGSVHIIPEKLGTYIINSKGITKTSNSNKKKERQEIKRKIKLKILDYYKIRLQGKELDLFLELFCFGCYENVSINNMIRLLDTIDKETEMLPDSFRNALAYCTLTNIVNDFKYNSLKSKYNMIDMVCTRYNVRNRFKYKAGALLWRIYRRN